MPNFECPKISRKVLRSVGDILVLVTVEFCWHFSLVEIFSLVTFLLLTVYCLLSTVGTFWDALGLFKKQFGTFWTLDIGHFELFFGSLAFLDFFDLLYLIDMFDFFSCFLTCITFLTVLNFGTFGFVLLSAAPLTTHRLLRCQVVFTKRCHYYYCHNCSCYYCHYYYCHYYYFHNLNF